jgi:hypothetical protein
MMKWVEVNKKGFCRGYRTGTDRCPHNSTYPENPTEECVDCQMRDQTVKKALYDIGEKYGVRELTKEEMLDRLLNQFDALVEYWHKVKVTEKECKPGESVVKYRLEGLLFSIFATLDGCSMGLPAFHLVPDPHPADPDTLKEQGENWWPLCGDQVREQSINNDVSLHDMSLHDMNRSKAE